MLLFCYFTLLEQVNETGAEGVSTVIWWMWLTPFIGQWMISLSGRVNLITSMAEISRKELNTITQRLVSAQTGDYDWYTDTPSVPRQEQNRRRLLHRLRWYQISLDNSSCHAKETGRNAGGHKIFEMKMSYLHASRKIRLQGSPNKTRGKKYKIYRGHFKVFCILSGTHFMWSMHATLISAAVTFAFVLPGTDCHNDGPAQLCFRGPVDDSISIIIHPRLPGAPWERDGWRKRGVAEPPSG